MKIGKIVTNVFAGIGLVTVGMLAFATCFVNPTIQAEARKRSRVLNRYFNDNDEVIGSIDMPNISYDTLVASDIPTEDIAFDDLNDLDTAYDKKNGSPIKFDVTGIPKYDREKKEVWYDIELNSDGTYNIHMAQNE